MLFAKYVVIVTVDECPQDDQQIEAVAEYLNDSFEKCFDAFRNLVQEKYPDYRIEMR